MLIKAPRFDYRGAFYDHLIGETKEGQRRGYAESLCRLALDHQLDFGQPPVRR
jgi:hypothetical protein